MVSHSINEASLTVTSTVESGGSAVIHNFREASGRDARQYDDKLYKKYLTARNPEPVLRLIEIAENFPQSDRDYVHEHFSWPTEAVVNEEGMLAGILMPTAPVSFVAPLAKGAKRPRDLNYLIFEERSARIGIPSTNAWQKLKIIHGLASAFAFLERHGLVHEDPAAQNILWTVDTTPAVYLLDCDSIREEAARPAEPLATTVDWTDPRVLANEADRPDFSSNSYILALATARIYGNPSWTPSPTDNHTSIISGLPVTPEIRDLVTRSITSSGPRPPVRDWLNVLDAALNSADQSSPPDALVVPALNEPTLGGPAWDSIEKATIAIGILAGALVALLLVVFVI